MQGKQRFSRGFTIIELLIVIVVISILIGIAIPRFRGMREEGNIAKSKGELRTLQAAVESYYIHNDAYPATSSAALETALAAAVPNIINNVPTDPFDTTSSDYVYVRGGTNDKYYLIYSVGPGQNGSAIIKNDAIVETNGASTIYISNLGQDTQP